MSLVARRVWFIVAGAVAGFLSGAMVPHVFGVRGLILGMAISVGAAMLNPWRRDPDGRTPGLARTLGVAAGVAVAAFGLILAWHEMVPPPHHDIDLNRMNAVAAGLGCVVTAAGILLGYRARRAGIRRAWAWFVLTPFATAALRSWSVGGIEAFPFSLLLGSTPFVLLWLLAARLTDPGWSHVRWLRAASDDGAVAGHGAE
ncbi:MAG: hypothetical protein FJ221_00210 [Lentisphaerae bacterium]|nr:hypothetical protein [Lentisphaerota bacterium]